MPRLNNLIDFKNYKIFADADTYTSIIILNEFKIDNYFYSNILGNYTIKYKEFIKDKAIFKKLFKSGIATLSDKTFLVEKIDGKYYCNYKNVNYEIEEGILAYYFKLTKIKDVLKTQFMLFPYDLENKIIQEDIIKNLYPLTYTYLLAVKGLLSQRDKGKTEKYDYWYAYGRKQGFHNFSSNKVIVVPSIIGGDCFPKVFDISDYKDKRILFSAGFMAELQEKDVNKFLYYFSSLDFFNYVKDNGRIYPTKDFNYYSISVTELNRLCEKISN